ncbi:MAG: type II toxin-antitoxin system RelE/ParE family toxin [Candidatus Fermentibacteraceae bacterium]|nr:type II toxin-antitoxin system RelE/ParE family toxin [Candidatus Fermentibacteraceae bacterium]
MAELVWTRPALDNLNEIAEYIALDNPDAALRLTEKVFSSIETLKQFPDSGRHPLELTGTRYTELVINPCRVFCRREGNDVFILFVMRCEREFRKFMIGERRKTTQQVLLSPSAIQYGITDIPQ